MSKHEMASIPLATPEAFRAIKSKDPAACDRLPYVYGPFNGGARFKCAGIAGVSYEGGANSVAIVEAGCPGSFVLPGYLGDQLSLAEIESLGGVPAADYL